MDITKDKKEYLLKLLQDTDSFNKLSKWTNSLNIFDVLKISKRETQHSNMLGWLFDPNGSHGLGDSFLYALLVRLSDSIFDKNNALRLLSSDLSSFIVFRERENIDILLVSSILKTVIAIENKIGSAEHLFGKTDLSQLEVYSHRLDDFYKDYTQIKIFLTPNGAEPTISDWLVLTYKDILSLIEYVYQNKVSKLKEEASLLIKNYIETIKRNVVMDEDLVKICNEIYSKHKIALDLIYENRDDRTLMISKICLDVLKSKQSEGIEVNTKSTKSAVSFTTKFLKEKFKNIEDIEKPFYQIQIRNRGYMVFLECVFHKKKETNISKHTKNIINMFIPKSGNIIKDDNWEWKRAYRINLDNAEEKEDNDIRKWLETRLKDISKKENEINKNCV